MSELYFERRSIIQEDGAQWDLYNLSSGFLLFTDYGRNLASGNRQFWRDLRAYRKAVAAESTGKKALDSSGSATRQYFSSGGNSDVYTFNENLLVKEGKNSQSLNSSLQRMDRLCTVIQRKVPRWIDMPIHYGLLSAADLPRQYMLMQRIDGGVTVQDMETWVEDKEGLTDFKKAIISREMGDLSLAQCGRVRDRFDQAQELLYDALETEGLRPSDYLTDFHEGNVLVERISTPDAFNPFKLWVIDQ